MKIPNWVKYKRSYWKEAVVLWYGLHRQKLLRAETKKHKRKRLPTVKNFMVASMLVLRFVTIRNAVNSVLQHMLLATHQLIPWLTCLTFCRISLEPFRCTEPWENLEFSALGTFPLCSLHLWASPPAETQGWLRAYRWNHRNDPTLAAMFQLSETVGSVKDLQQPKVHFHSVTTY